MKAKQTLRRQSWKGEKTEQTGGLVKEGGRKGCASRGGRMTHLKAFTPHFLHAETSTVVPS